VLLDLWPCFTRPANDNSAGGRIRARVLAWDTLDAADMADAFLLVVDLAADTVIAYDEAGAVVGVSDACADTLAALDAAADTLMASDDLA
jgi:hypothetical protein